MEHLDINRNIVFTNFVELPNFPANGLGNSKKQVHKLVRLSTLFSSTQIDRRNRKRNRNFIGTLNRKHVKFRNSKKNSLELLAEFQSKNLSKKNSLETHSNSQSSVCLMWLNFELTDFSVFHHEKKSHKKMEFQNWKFY